MGRLTYGSSRLSIDIDDRALAHVQVVIGAKLRRGEAMYFSWRDGTEAGGGRGSIWIDSAIELHFAFESAVRPEMNRKWLEQLALLANTPQGLHLIDEPVAEPSDVRTPELIEPVLVEAARLAAVGK